MDRRRSARAAKLGALVATETAKRATVRTTNVVRSKQAARSAAQARHEQFAAQVVAVLGGMRGAAMKIGQLLSILDTGLIPEQQREAFQAKLAELQDSAPKVPWSVMRDHIERELGQPLDAAFAEFNRNPAAAASIGQVYRARMPDGQAVAVKVQYPDAQAAVTADLKNFRLLLKLYRMVQPQLNTDALADEMQERLLDELDYGIEAANTRMFADLYRGHPFIRVPDVIEALSSRRIIVTEWADGRPLSDAFEAPLEVRNRVAEILFRFYTESAYRFCVYSGDPHPGNCLLLEDNSIAFLDFGMVKKIDQTTRDAELAALRACAGGDIAAVAAIARERGVFAEKQSSDRSFYNTYLHTFGWYLRDEKCEITAAEARNQISALLLPHSARTRPYKLPTEHAVRLRAEVQVAAVLGYLRPHINLYAIAREWIDGAEPVTELGLIQRDWARTSRRPERQAP